MFLGDKNKLNRIEELKNKLFSKDYKPGHEHHEVFAYKSKKDVPLSWDMSNKSKKRGIKDLLAKTSFFRKFFIFSIVFFILAVGYASYMLFVGGNTVSNDNIDISILGNSFTAGGEELPLQVTITNNNSSSLELVDLIVEYPKNSGSDFLQDTERLRSSVGMIPAGAIRNENVKLILFGEQGSVRKIKVSIEYRVEGSNAIFVKEKFYEVSISSSPIDLSMDAPFEISPNQEITFKIKTTLNATRATRGILLKVDYPLGFQFISADKEPAYGNNVWDLGDLAPGIEHQIAVTGKMVDVFDGEEKTFRVWSGSQSLADKSAIGIVFNSLGHTIAIKKPFIEAKLFVNNVYEREYASDNRTPISGQIHWVNNLDTVMTDLVIQAKISGNAVNRKAIDAKQGFYDSNQDVIIWDKNSQRDFGEVNPGASGSVDFSLTPLSSALGSVLSDPSISIEVSISGKQPLEGYNTKELKNSESKIIRIITDVGFAPKLLYYSGPFTNKGPIPPKAEQETTYTVVWTVTNTSNNVSKAQIQSSLPNLVRFVGTTSPSSEDLTYNASTKIITWNIGKISKGTGISSPTREVSFQIAFTPSLSQVGTMPYIINDSFLSGTDDFAKVGVKVSRPALNTFLLNDGSFKGDGGRVID